MNAEQNSSHQSALMRWVRIGCRMLVLFYVVAAGLALSRQPDLAHFIGFDFLTFWAASHLALGGDPVAALDAAQLKAAAQIALPDFDKPLLWHYPPTFQLLVMPLALFPYVASAVAWLVSTLLAYLAAMRRLVPHPDALLLAAAFPAVAVNFRIGQNGFLSTALVAGAMALLRTRPVLAGVLIGLLVYKPHLGMLIPLALLCARQWTAFLSAAVTALAFMAASAAVLGVESWTAFAKDIPHVGQRLDDGAIKWSMMPSVYVGLRMLGLDAATSYMAHAGVAALGALAVAWAWLRRVPFPLAVALLVCATVLVSPYIFDYDLTLLAIPVMLLVADGLQRGWLAGERVVLALAWLAPLAGVINRQELGVPVGPILLLALFAVALRRAAVFAADSGARFSERRLFGAPREAAATRSG